MCVSQRRYVCACACERGRWSVGGSARQSGRSAGAAPKVRTPHNDVGNKESSKEKRVEDSLEECLRRLIIAGSADSAQESMNEAGKDW